MHIHRFARHRRRPGSAIPGIFRRVGSPSTEVILPSRSPHLRCGAVRPGAHPAAAIVIRQAAPAATPGAVPACQFPGPAGSTQCGRIYRPRLVVALERSAKRRERSSRSPSPGSTRGTRARRRPRGSATTWRTRRAAVVPVMAGDIEPPRASHIAVATDRRWRPEQTLTAVNPSRSASQMHRGEVRRGAISTCTRVTSGRRLRKPLVACLSFNRRAERSQPSGGKGVSRGMPRAVDVGSATPPNRHSLPTTPARSAPARCLCRVQAARAQQGILVGNCQMTGSHTERGARRPRVRVGSPPRQRVDRSAVASAPARKPPSTTRHQTDPGGEHLRQQHRGGESLWPP